MQQPSTFKLDVPRLFLECAHEGLFRATDLFIRAHYLSIRNLTKDKHLLALTKRVCTRVFFGIFGK